MEKEDELVNYLNGHNVPFSRIGEVMGNSVIVDEESYGLVEEWKNIYDNTLAEKMENAI
jgi:phosphoribosylformylglycinamidine synthase